MMQNGNNLESDACITAAKEIYVWYKQGHAPAPLSSNILSMFQSFKAAYDSKNIVELGSIISDTYTGSSYSAVDKPALIDFFSQVFNSIPPGIELDLTINIYKILEDSRELFKAIADFQGRLKVAFLLSKPFASGRVYVNARPEMPDGTWKITGIDVIKD